MLESVWLNLGVFSEGGTDVRFILKLRILVRQRMTDFRIFIREFEMGYSSWSQILVARL